MTLIGHARQRFTGAIAIWASLWSLATPAAAQQGWASATTFSLDTPDVAHVAVNASGTTVAVWVSCGLLPPDDCTIATARRTPTQGWMITTGITAPGSYATPEAAVDPAGNIIVVWNSGSVIQATRSTPNGLWQLPPATLSTTGARDPHVAVDGTGNAIAVWVGPGGIDDQFEVVQSARYTAASDTWSSARSLSAVGVVDPHVAVDPAGNATVVWGKTAGTISAPIALVEAVRYTAASDSWGFIEALTATSATSVDSVRVVSDGAGNATAVWQRINGGMGQIAAARFSVTTGAWAIGTLLSPPAADAGLPEVAIDPAGNITAVWMRSDFTVEASRSTAAGVWSGPAILTDELTAAFLPNVAMDGVGNTTFVWLELTGAAAILRTARLTADGRFLPVMTIPTADALLARPVADTGGNITVIWQDVPLSGGNTSLKAVRWEATPRAPVITSVIPGDGSLTIAFAAPVTTEPLFAPIDYEYSTNFGTTWTSRTPASTASPLVIGGLTNGVSSLVLLRAVNRAGGGVDARVAATPVPAPGPPSDLRAEAVSGNSVTLSWTPPSGGVAPTAFVLEGGVQPGQVLASIPTGGVSSRFTFVAPSGVFFVRMHAVSGASRSVASNEVQIFVNVPVPPSAPANLLGLVNGPALALSWTNSYGGGAPTGLQLHVSGAVNAVLPLGLAETFAVPVVPPGTYTIRLAATNASGVSGLSNPVALTVPGACSGMPGVPTRVVATRTGSAIRVAWDPPETGAAVSAYWLIVGGSFVGAFPTTARTLAGTVGPGTYSFAVVAVNACGPGAQSLPETVVVP